MQDLNNSQLLRKPLFLLNGRKKVVWQENLGRLLSLGTRESGLIVLGIYLLFICSLYFLNIYNIMQYAFALLPAIIGGCAFLADQRKSSYRFFSEHGVSPRMVWIARVCFGGIAAVPGFMGCSIACNWLHETQWGVNVLQATPEIRLPSDLILYYALFFPLGVLVSLLVRYGVLAPFIAASIAYFWIFAIAKLRFWGFPDWFAAYPLAVGLFTLSWLRAPDWINERNSARHYRKLSYYALSIVVVYLFGLSLHRAYEIPYIEPPVPNYPINYRDLTIDKQDGIHFYQAYGRLLYPPTAEEQESTRLYDELRQDTWKAIYYVLSGPGKPNIAILMKESEIESERTQRLINRWVQLFERPINFVTTPPNGLIHKYPQSGASQGASSTPEKTIVESMYLMPTIYNWLEQDGLRLERKGELKEAVKRYFTILRLQKNQQRPMPLSNNRLFGDNALLNNYRDWGTLELIIHWASHPQQTKELLTYAEKNCPALQPDYHETMHPDYKDFYLLTRYLQTQQLLGFRNDSATSNLVSQADRDQFNASHRTLRTILQYCPWERIRAQRLLTYEFWKGTGNQVYRQAKWNLDSKRGNAFLPYEMVQDFSEVGNQYHLKSLFYNYQERLKILHIFLLRLRLNAYRVENGHYPKDLAELEPFESPQLPFDGFDEPLEINHKHWKVFAHGGKYDVSIPRNEDIVRELYHLGQEKFRGKYDLSKTAFLWVPHDHVYPKEVEIDSTSDPSGKTKVLSWFQDYGGNTIAAPENERDVIQRYGYSYPIGPANEEE